MPSGSNSSLSVSTVTTQKFACAVTLPTGAQSELEFGGIMTGNVLQKTRFSDAKMLNLSYTSASNSEGSSKTCISLSFTVTEMKRYLKVPLQLQCGLLFEFYYQIRAFSVTPRILAPS